MEIRHRFTFSGKDNLLRELESLDARFETTQGFRGSFLITLETSESEPIWLEIEQLAKIFGAAELVSTHFSQEEILDAEWLTIERTNYQGYPQPETGWLQKRPNYQNYCSQCGVYEQVGSFFLKKEPALRNNDFVSLFWTSAVLAKREIFDSLIEKHIVGFQQVDVLLQKTKTPSTIVAQMIPTVTARPGLTATDGFTGKTCDSCGVTKYLPVKKGKLRLQKNFAPEGIDIIATHEWFGDGAMAFREILVSQRVAKLAIKQKWKGIRLKVAEMV